MDKYLKEFDEIKSYKNIIGIKSYFGDFELRINLAFEDGKLKVYYG